MSVTVTITASELHAALAWAFPHASKDKMLPILNAVHIALESGELTVQATDRYTLARKVISVEVGEPGSAFEATLQADDVKALLPLLKRAGKYDAIVTVDDDKARITLADGTETTLRTVAGNYPPLTRILTTEGEPIDVDTVRVNVEQLARFRAAWLPKRDRDNTHVRLQQFRENGPYMVTLEGWEDGYIGAIMPRRVVN